MKDNSEYTPNLDPRNEPYKTAIHELREAILKEIEKLLTRIFFSQGFPSLYKDYLGELDYKLFEQKLLQTLEEEVKKELPKGESNLPYIFRILSEEGLEFPEMCQVNGRQDHKDILHSILSLDYSPPKEWKDIFVHLGYLYSFWLVNINNPEPIGEMLFLLVFCKLMGISHELFANYTTKCERDIKRMKKTFETIRENTKERKEFVIAIYQHGKL